MKAILLISIFSLSAHAGIFGTDNRYESMLEGDAETRARALAVPAIVRASMLKKKADGNYRAEGFDIGFCPTARFASQPQLANCSASLIAPDIVLTAAHCIDEEMGLGCSQFKIVFDYAMGAELKTIKKEQVYDCSEVLYFNFDLTLQSDDLAMVRLDRKVTDRTPIKIAQRLPVVGEGLTMIGYPLGIPQKVVDDGVVESVDSANVSFNHDLDTFSCNSGGPIFNLKGEQLGVLVRGTGTSTDYSHELECHDWTHSEPGYDMVQGNSLVHLRQRMVELGIF